MATTVRVGRRNDLTDVAGVAVGHHQRTGRGWLTGTTVVVPPPGTVGGADVRGGGPATRDTDALAPTTMVSHVDAVCFTGGSAYGLDVAGGVMAWLEEQGRGFRVGEETGSVVPIVPTAAVFDLGVGGRFANRPDASFGYRAAAGARVRSVRQGTVGAGTGTRAGSLKGGVGSASAVTATGVTIGALVVVNAAGSVLDDRTGELWGARLGLGEEFGRRRRPARAEVAAFAADPTRGAPFNTTLAVIATDARLSKPECVRLAGAGHDGLARAISPVHGYTDGDIVVGLATGGLELADPANDGRLRPADPRFALLGPLFAVAADAVSRAIVHAVLHASSAGPLLSYAERFPSARDAAHRSRRVSDRGG